MNEQTNNTQAIFMEVTSRKVETIEEKMKAIEEKAKEIEKANRAKPETTR